jgi:hypothetical protein
MTRQRGIFASSAAGDHRHAQERDPALAVTLARLETCATFRDARAAARALDAMATSPDGAWLLLQMAAAGLRALSAGTQQLPPATVHTATAQTPTAIYASAADLHATTHQERTSSW